VRLNEVKAMADDYQNHYPFAALDPKRCRITPVEVVWADPCWLSLPLEISAPSPSGAPLPDVTHTVEFNLDVLSRETFPLQINRKCTHYCQELEKVSAPWADAIRRASWDLQDYVRELNDIPIPPCPPAALRKFENVSLAQIVKHEPDELEVYLATDLQRKSPKNYLRIHTPLSSHKNGALLLRCEIPIPDLVDWEDFEEWLKTLIQNLPKKARPATPLGWTNRLRFYHSLPRSGFNTGPWNTRDKIILAFGNSKDFGPAAKYRIARTEIEEFKLSGTEVEMRVRVPTWRDNSVTEVCIFIFFNRDEPSALLLRNQLMHGFMKHFMLGKELTGMVRRTQGQIDWVNVPTETILARWSRPGMALGSFSYPKFKHKSYEYFSKSKESRNGFIHVIE
jgi:hypothetical protein